MKWLEKIISLLQSFMNNHSKYDSSQIIDNDIKETIMQEQITKNFTLTELTKSSTALSKGIKNIPTNADYENMKALCINVLQPLRERLGKPITINSCFRCQALNESVGGAKSSQHLCGKAADIEIMGMSNYDLACYIRDNMDFDQVILEFANNLHNNPNDGWVHVSWNGSMNRKQCLTINKLGTRLGLIR